MEYRNIVHYKYRRILSSIEDDGDNTVEVWAQSAKLCATIPHNTTIPHDTISISLPYVYFVIC